MKYIIIGFLKVALAAFFIAGAQAQQGSIPVNSIPYSKGPGVQGYGAVGGAVGGGTKCLLDTAPPTFGSCASGSAETNTLNAQSGNYSIVAADAGKTIYVTGGPFTVTLPGVGGFVGTAQLSVCNGNANSSSGHAVKLAGFPSPVFGRLYPKTCVTVAIENGVWEAKYVPGRFRPTFQPVLYVDNGGNNANAGLISNAAGNALQTVQQCLTILQNEYDLIGQQPVCSPTGGQTLVGSFSITGQLVGSVVISITGNGGVATLRPTATTNSILLLSDWAPGIISNNITWDCTGGGAACIGAFLHQDTVFEVNTGTIFIGNGSGASAVYCDNRCLFNTITNFTISGRFGYAFIGNAGAIFQIFNGVYLNAGLTLDIGLFKLTNTSMTFNGLLQSGGSTIGVDVFQLYMMSRACMTNFTVSGTFGALRKYIVVGNSVLSNPNAAVIPGTNPGIVTLSGFSNGFAPDNLGTNTGVNAGGC